MLLLVLTFYYLGIGCLFSCTIIALQAAVEPKDIGKTDTPSIHKREQFAYLVNSCKKAVVTGLGNFSRILGGALGIGETLRKRSHRSRQIYLNLHSCLVCCLKFSINTRASQDITYN